MAGWLVCDTVNIFFLVSLNVYSFFAQIGSSQTEPIYHFLCMYIIFNTWSLKIDQKWEKLKISFAKLLLLQRHPSWQGIWTQKRNTNLKKLHAVIPEQHFA